MVQIVPTFRIPLAKANGGVIIGRTKSGKAIHEDGHAHTSAAWTKKHGYSWDDDHKDAAEHHSAAAKKHNEMGDKLHAQAEHLERGAGKEFEDTQDVKGDTKKLRAHASAHWKRADHLDEQAGLHRGEIKDRKERKKAKRVVPVLKSSLGDYKKKHGIVGVASDRGTIGWSESEQAWYGWSHRAISSFKVGSKVGKGHVLCGEFLSPGKRYPVGHTAKTLDDAKCMAQAFSDGVS